MKVKIEKITKSLLQRNLNSVVSTNNKWEETVYDFFLSYGLISQLKDKITVRRRFDQGRKFWNNLTTF